MEVITNLGKIAKVYSKSLTLYKMMYFFIYNISQEMSILNVEGKKWMEFFLGTFNHISLFIVHLVLERF